MANNSFNALVAEVNEKITEMNQAISDANGATSIANAAAETANDAADEATAAAKAALAATNSANEAISVWSNIQTECETVAAGNEASVAFKENSTCKMFSFQIPRGATGEKGPKGDTGKSGVTFKLSGTKLYITTG